MSRPRSAVLAAGVVAVFTMLATGCGGPAEVPLTFATNQLSVGAVTSGGSTTFHATVPAGGSHTLRICPATTVDRCDGDPVVFDVTAAEGPRDPSLVLGTSGQVRLAHLWEATLTVDLEAGRSYRFYCAVPFHADSGEHTLVHVGGA